MPATSEIFVTGLGAVTPLGAGIDENWNAVLNGKRAFSAISRFDLGGLSYTTGGLLPRGEVSAAGIASEAVAEALAGASLDPAGAALISGSNFGEKFESTPLNHYDVARETAKRCGTGGPVASISLSCSSGASAIALAADWIKCGRAKAVAVVGVDVISLYSWSGLASLRTISREGAVRPFDISRAGTVFAEGAAAIILEDAESCAARGGKALAVLSGWSTGNNGFHLTAPPPRAAGSLQVMQRALSEAGIAPEETGFITMHATGTKANDLTESEAVTDLIGDASASIPVTALKASAGHLLGAAGAFEAAMTVMALQNSLIPPVAVKPTPDPSIPPLQVVTDKPLPKNAESALTNSAGFGGCNASLVFTRPGRTLAAKAPSDSARGVAIVSAGFISPLGIGLEEAKAAIEEGEPAIFPVERFAPPEGTSGEAGEVPPFEPSEILPSPKAYLDRQSLLALGAAAIAMREAGPVADKTMFGISTGTSWGPVETQELFFADCLKKGPRFVRPMLFPHTYANAAASLISMEWELKGPHLSFAGGGNASSLAIIAALDSLRLGSCDRIIAGGSEALSATRWNAGKDTLFTAVPPGEGAAFFVLERDSGQPSLGKILGAGISAKNAEDAAELAIRDAGIEAADISAIYTSFNAGKVGGFKLARVVTPELLTGHCDGASCAVQLAYSLADHSTGLSLIMTHESGVYAALAVETHPEK